MSGAIPLYAFVVWTGETLPLTQFMTGGPHTVESPNKKQQQNQLWVSVIEGNLPIEISITLQERDRILYCLGHASSDPSQLATHDILRP